MMIRNFTFRSYLLSFLLIIALGGEKDVYLCANNECKNNAFCQEIPNDYKCLCTQQWTGVYCEVDIDECLSSPCKNGAVCTNTNGSFICICPYGYSSSDCSVSTNASKTTTCPPSRIGSSCQYSDPCVSKPCKNAGLCSSNPFNGTYKCICKGFIGSHCDFDINECNITKQSPCQNGLCTNTIGSYYCLCEPGWTGPDCSDTINQCQSKPCLNNGTCLAEINAYRCVCIKGYSGLNCESKLVQPATSTVSLPCQKNTCLNNGTCLNRFENAFCNCTNDYTGLRCETRFDVCSGQVCLNGGTCINNLGAFQCICQTYFTGKRCETSLCPNSDCYGAKKNNGRCDLDCNSKACGFDGGECIDNGVYANCGAVKQGINCGSLFQNGVCDSECSSSECLLDGRDCQPSIMICSEEAFCRPRFSDGHCDKACSNEACIFDGKDCSNFTTPSTFHVPTGLLVFVVLAKIEIVEDMLTDFLRNVSVLLRCVVVKGDMFRWEENGIEGTKIFLKFAPSNYGNECFSNLENAVDFINQSLVKNSSVLSLPISSVSGSEPPVTPPASPTNQYIIIFVTIIIFLVIILFGVITIKNKKKVKTWFPSGFRNSTHTLSDHCSSNSNIINSSSPSLDNLSQFSLPFDSGKSQNWCPEFANDQSNASGNYISNIIGPSASSHKNQEPIREEEHETYKNQQFINNNNNERFLLHVAARSNNADVATFLLESGADPNLLDQLGRTPLHCAIAADAYNVAQVLLCNPGTNLNARAADGSTAIMIAVKLSLDMSIIGELIKFGVDLNITDNTGRTVLHWAAAVNNLDAAILILHNGGINKDGQDENGLTALHIAAREDSYKVAHLLLHNSANPDITDLLDKRPRDIALEKNNMEMSHLLMQYSSFSPNNSSYFNYAYNPPTHPPKAKKSKTGGRPDTRVSTEAPLTLLEKRKRKKIKNDAKSVASKPDECIVQAVDNGWQGQQGYNMPYNNNNNFTTDMYNNNINANVGNFVVGDPGKKLPISPTHMQAVKNSMTFNYPGTGGLLNNGVINHNILNVGAYHGSFPQEIMYQLTPPNYSPPQKPLETSPLAGEGVNFLGAFNPRENYCVTPPPESPLHSQSRQLLDINQYSSYV